MSFKLFKTMSFLLFSLLTACGVSKENFDCKYGKGVGCRSISEVNTMVNEGQLRDPSKPLANQPKNSVLEKHSSEFEALNPVQRIQEAHLRIWVAPFQDEQGHFHEASVIHTVLCPGYWTIEGV
jgi:conjugal transfer pilus assembly protein TraV